MTEQEHAPALPLDPPAPERCAPPVLVDARGGLVADPYALLGLDPGTRPEPEAVRRAWLDKLQQHPPEKDPEGARRLREARDRLLEPERLLERLVGTLHAPDPQAWGLPTDAEGLDSPAARDDTERLDPKSRILGQAIVYALVEDTFVKAQGG